MPPANAATLTSNAFSLALRLAGAFFIRGDSRGALPKSPGSDFRCRTSSSVVITSPARCEGSPPDGGARGMLAPSMAARTFARAVANAPVSAWSSSLSTSCASPPTTSTRHPYIVTLSGAPTASAKRLPCARSCFFWRPRSSPPLARSSRHQRGVASSTDHRLRSTFDVGAKATFSTNTISRKYSSSGTSRSNGESWTK